MKRLALTLLLCSAWTLTGCGDDGDTGSTGPTGGAGGQGGSGGDATGATGVGGESNGGAGAGGAGAGGAGGEGVDITTNWVRATTGTPIGALAVAIHGADGLDTVLGMGTTDIDGAAVVSISPTDAFWVAHASGGSFHDTWWFHNEMGNADSTRKNMLVSDDLFWDSVHTAAGVVADPAAGMLVVSAELGATATTDSGGTVMYASQAAAGLPDPTATETDGTGAIYVLNVAAGDVTVSLTGTSGTLMVTVRSYADALTVAWTL